MYRQLAGDLAAVAKSDSSHVSTELAAILLCRNASDATLLQRAYALRSHPEYVRVALPWLAEVLQLAIWRARTHLAPKPSERTRASISASDDDIEGEAYKVYRAAATRPPPSFANWFIFFDLVTDAMDSDLVGGQLEAARLRHWWGIVASWESDSPGREQRALQARKVLQAAATARAKILGSDHFDTLVTKALLFYVIMHDKDDNDWAEILDLLDGLQQGACAAFGYDSAERHAAALMHHLVLLKLQANASIGSNDSVQSTASWSDLGVPGVHDRASAVAVNRQTLEECWPKWTKWVLNS